MKNVSLLLLCSFCFLHSVACDTSFIFITGGSASGKTTFAKALVEKFGSNRALYISQDLYLDKRVQAERDYINGIPNFDNPSMVNWKLLKQDIAVLQRGLSIQVPIYDFALWMPVDFKHMTWKSIVIVEGIHVTQDELDSIPGLRIFLDVDEELRYQRRVLRDSEERGYSIEMIEETFFTMAVPYQKIFLDPTKDKADIFFENFDGKDYLEKAVAYVVRMYEKSKNARYKMHPVTIGYKDGKLYDKAS